MSFQGFPSGTRYTPVPNSLFGPLLEAIGDPAELKCILRVIWLLHHKKRHPRYVTGRELLADRVLLLGLKGQGVPVTEVISRGLRGGVERGTLLLVTVDRNGNRDEIYFLNDEAGKRAAAKMQGGDIVVQRDIPGEGAGDGPEGSQPNIFTLYEDNIGMLTPLLAEEIKEAEGDYPWSWIQEAFKIATTRNRRSWRYIEGTLRRWATEGKDDGEPGRYSQKTLSRKDLEEYLRSRGRLPES